MIKKHIQIVIPQGTKNIIKLLEDNGHSAYVVGGCVRDSLMKKEPHDWDICTSAPPEFVQKLFLLNHYRVYDTGIQHGTVSVANSSDLYEVTTYRVDGTYSDGRHPDSVSFVDDIVEDLSRRDFTINAMAYNEKDGLIDPFNGQEDLKKMEIRCVGNPAERFEEDALRILRAMRFAAVNSFSIEEETCSAMRSKKHLLSKIAAERKMAEISKFLPFTKSFLLIECSDILAECIPGLADFLKMSENRAFTNIYRFTAETICSCPAKLEPRLATLFLALGLVKNSICVSDGYFTLRKDYFKNVQSQATDSLRKMRFDNKTIRHVCELIKIISLREDNLSTKPAIKQVLRETDIQTFHSGLGLKSIILQRHLYVSRTKRFIANFCMSCEEAQDTLDVIVNAYHYVDEITRNNEPYRLSHLAIDGNVLIESGIGNGEQIGLLLNECLNTVIHQPELNTKKHLLSLISQTV